MNPVRDKLRTTKKLHGWALAFTALLLIPGFAGLGAYQYQLGTPVTVEVHGGCETTFSRRGNNATTTCTDATWQADGRTVRGTYTTKDVTEAAPFTAPARALGGTARGWGEGAGWLRLGLVGLPAFLLAAGFALVMWVRKRTLRQAVAAAGGDPEADEEPPSRVPDDVAALAAGHQLGAPQAVYDKSSENGWYWVGTAALLGAGALAMFDLVPYADGWVYATGLLVSAGCYAMGWRSRAALDRVGVYVYDHGLVVADKQAAGPVMRWDAYHDVALQYVRKSQNQVVAMHVAHLVDGTQIALPGAGGARMHREIAAVVLQRVRPQLDAGEALPFGELLVSRDGVRWPQGWGDQLVPWTAMEKVVHNGPDVEFVAPAYGKLAAVPVARTSGVPVLLVMYRLATAR